jgi:hypothetical protein
MLDSPLGDGGLWIGHDQCTLCKPNLRLSGSRGGAVRGPTLVSGENYLELRVGPRTCQDSWFTMDALSGCSYEP